MEANLALLGRIAGGVAHDLNNYLAVADTSLVLLARRVTGAEAQEEIQHARRALDAAIRLSRVVLEYARGGQPPMDELDLVALVRRVVSLFGRVVPTAVSLSISVEEEPAMVSGARAEVEQVVLNLVLNACDAMAAGGHLGVAVRGAAGEPVTLEITDTGPGSSEPPVAATRHQDGGAGLGLGIVRSVVDRHGAEFQLAPRTGGGMRATVTFTGADRQA